MSKNIKRSVSLALAAVMLVLSFASCGKGDSATSNAGTAASTSDQGANNPTAPTGPALTGEFKLIYEDTASNALNRVRNAVRNACGKTPSAIKASEATDEYNYAIYIGNTGKPESTAFIEGLDENEYGVKVIETEGSLIIVIAAKNSDITGQAVEVFMTEYISSEKGVANLLKTEQTVKLYTPPEVEKIPTNFGGIEFEEQIIKVTDTTGVPYTRMTKLQDGRLMMVYTMSNYTHAKYSSDNGLTWSESVIITSDIDQDDKDGKKLLIANSVPYQLADGTILVAYRANEALNRTDGDDSIKKTGKYHSSIRVMCSKDNGKTFVRHSIVWDLYEEGIQKWYSSCGLWEPHLGMLNGELACFFAIGKSVYDYNHIINSTEIFVYRDNSWVRAEYTSDEIPGSIKNGMPVWQELKEGGYIMAVESTQNQKGQYSNLLTAKLLTSRDGKHWVNQCDVYIPKKAKSKSGAPYVVQLPNGQIVVSYMTNDDQRSIDTSKTGDTDCIFKISVSKPGINVYDLDSEDDFQSSFNVLNIPVGYFATYGGMYVDNDYLYVYCATNYGGNQILLRRAPLSQFTQNN